MPTIKRYYFICCFLFFGFTSSICLAQNCLPDGISIFTQETIDDFSILYPDCVHIEGKLRLVSNNITNLDGLSHIQSVGGLLIKNDSLTDLSGLSSLRTIFGTLEINEANNLENLSGLESIDTIHGDLLLYSNTKLENIWGLSSLKSIGNNLAIGGNSILNSLDGLESLQQIKGNLYVGGNLTLKNIDGLSSLESINGLLSFFFNAELENLNGLKSLKSVRSDFFISYNFKLKSLNSLNQLEFVGGSIEINGNDQLTDLSGFGCLSLIGTESLGIFNNTTLKSLKGIEHLNLSNLTFLRINNNPILEVCATQNVCEYLSSGKDYFIIDNGNGCKDEDEINNFCQSAAEQSFTCTSGPYPNPSSDFLMLNCDCSFNNRIQYKIIDITGRQVLDGTFNNRPIDISSLVPATYFLKLKDANELELSFTFVKTQKR